MKKIALGVMEQGWSVRIFSIAANGSRIGDVDNF